MTQSQLINEIFHSKFKGYSQDELYFNIKEFYFMAYVVEGPPALDTEFIMDLHSTAAYTPRQCFRKERDVLRLGLGAERIVYFRPTKRRRRAEGGQTTNCPSSDVALSPLSLSRSQEL